jgi:hypothetical protein
MSDDLKRCPFCGGEPRVFHHQNKWFGETWHIECLDDNCGCGTCHHESADIAATVWNRRIEAQAAELEDQSKQIASQMNVIYDISAEVQNLRELLAAAYIELSGKDEHASDCATSNAPAMTPGRCDCD